MKRIATTILALLIVGLVAMPAFAQEEGDYRTHDSGDWSNAQIWQRYNGSAWVAIATPPAGSETITIDGIEDDRDSVFVDTDVTITGHVINKGILEANDLLTIGDGGVYEHARDAGEIPQATWAEGSTLLMTGTSTEAPDDRGQSYYNIIFDTPDLFANFNMDMDSVVIGGDITVRDTGLGRWYLTSALPNEGSLVTIMGDVIVEGGAFSVQGTSNANTTFTVEHYGNVNVTGGNFSISRGSQGNGTTTWTLYEGDFFMDNAKTQSSTITPGGAKFVFAKDGTQTLTLGDNIDFSAFPIEVSSGTTLEMGMSKIGGSSDFVVNEGATIATQLPGGIAEIVADAEIPAIIEENASFEFNGTEAQVTSELMPTVVADLIIDNPEGVKLSQETTINGVLRLQAGVFDNTIPFELGPEGSISEEGGSLLVDVASEDENEIPQSFFVDQNFPNPFNPSTVIRYGLPVASDVTITIYNTLGQQVKTLTQGYKNAGMHEVTFDASNMSSGLYIYRVAAGEMNVTKSMVLVE